MKPYDQKTAEGILFTDQYQLTMAQLYFKHGLHETQAQFEHFFRDYPDYGKHQAGYCVNAGLEWLIQWMKGVSFRQQDISYLRNQKAPSGKPVFEEDFLGWLQENGNFNSLTLTSIAEGRVIHPDVPVTVVRGPMIMAQILETALLNQLNYQILIATKASRISLSGRGKLLLEFGTRRGQDRGANAGVRAALIGGADFSSNVGISHVLGYPPKGTHSHSMVQLFLALGMTEQDAFQAYADLYPENCILLVDTIDTLASGIPNAIKVFENLKSKGHQPVGVRLDSGDLAYLGIRAAKMLNEAGFEDVKIVLSNELDEITIWQILTQISEDAPHQGVDPDQLINRLVYGVGTKLITSDGHPALGGVYKLTAIYRQGKWEPAIKVSESLAKTPNPGNKTVWRIYDRRDVAVADLLGLNDEKVNKGDEIFLQHPTEASKSRLLQANEVSGIEKLMVNILDCGNLVYEFPEIETIRKIRQRDIDRLDSGVKRLLNPHIYHVSLTQKLWDLKQKLIREYRS